MKTRSIQLEMMDADRIPEADLRGSLDFIRWSNQLFGANRAVLQYFGSQELPPRFRVLDLGTGAGDIPQALAQWARKQGKRADITAVDLNAECVAYAQKFCSDPDVHFKVASAFDLPSFGEFDFITTSAFFHHLSDEAIVRLLTLMDRYATRGFLVNDLYRSRPAHWGARLITCGRCKMLMNDAPLSVDRAFVEADLRGYAEEARVRNARVWRHPFFRILLGR